MEVSRCAVCGGFIPQLPFGHTCDPVRLVDTKCSSRYASRKIAVIKTINGGYSVVINDKIERPHCEADDAFRALNVYIWEIEDQRRHDAEWDAHAETDNRERERKRSKWYLISLIAVYALGAGWFHPIFRALDTTPAQDIRWLGSIMHIR